MSGVSGSGKSTYIRKVASKLWFPHFQSGDIDGAVVVSADHYFMRPLEGVYNFDPANLSAAHGKCFQHFIEACQNKVELVFVDNTNTTIQEIAPYILGAQAYGYDAEIITLRCELEADLNRVMARNVHNVPKHSILKQESALRLRQLPHYWKQSYIRVEA